MADRGHENALRAVRCGRYSVQGKNGPVERQVRPGEKPRHPEALEPDICISYLYGGGAYASVTVCRKFNICPRF